VLVDLSLDGWICFSEPLDLFYRTNGSLGLKYTQFTAAEWKTLCDKVVAAIERGYDKANVVAKTVIANYFTNNTVSAVLLKSATYDVEVKNTVPNTMYFKADSSTIDGISGTDFLIMLGYIVGGAGGHLPQ
jgi:hypothetical protein